MAWTFYRWVWQLEAPLHIGLPPAGALHRTRLYVPARSLWGAMTAEVARELAREKGSSFPDYQRVGEKIRQQTRMSYLFPAQKVEGKWKAWLPKYCQRKGLMWKREDGYGPISDATFRRWLLNTRLGTSIDPASDSAAEGTLREHEVINPWSRWGQEIPVLDPVGLVGYLFLADGADQEIREKILTVDQLFIGGDARYGLGRLRKVEGEEKENNFFGAPVDLESGDHPKVKAPHILAHALNGKNENNEQNEIKNTDLSGVLEQLVAWDHGELKSQALAWVPGSVSRTKELQWQIKEDGLWELY